VLAEGDKVLVRHPGGLAGPNQLVPCVMEMYYPDSSWAAKTAPFLAAFSGSVALRVHGMDDEHEGTVWCHSHDFDSPQARALSVAVGLS
jgi:hypothetical protein